MPDIIEDEIQLLCSRREKQFYYLGARYPLASFERIGRKKDKAVMIIPALQTIQFSDMDRRMILEYFATEWGGHHHVMFLPTELYSFYMIHKRYKKDQPDF